MKYVYIIQSERNPERHYTGMTDDLKSRLKAHNAGEVKATKAFVPWQIQTYLGFKNEDRAVEFERYLKSGSGRSFARRRL